MTATDRARRPGVGGSTIFRRHFLATAAVVAAVLAFVLAGLSLSARRTADAALARGLEATRRHAAAVLDGRERALASAALVFAQDPAFRALVLERRPADLLDQALEAEQRTGASWAQITDGDGVRLARSDQPTAPPLQLAGTALVGGALGGQVTTGGGVAGDTALFQAVAVPVLLGGRVAGVLMAAAAIDSAFVVELAGVTGSEVLLYLLDAQGTPRVAASTLPRGDVLAALAATHARATADAPVEATIDGASWVGRGQPLRSAGGEQLGGLVTLRSRDAELRPYARLRRRIVLAGALGLALACALSWAVARQIARPILALTEAARRAQAGDYAAAELSLEPPGELGALAAAVRSVLSGVAERRTLAEFLAQHGQPAPARPIAVPAGAVAPGAVMARRYEIQQVLGVGGSGVVYRALDRELGEPVALKTLRPESLAGGEPALERFRDELRYARRISHPNVVRIHDIGEDGGTYFITMEYVAGLSVHDLIVQLGPLPAAVAGAIGAQLCQALEVAHTQGVIHRDVKPHNLMLQADGVLKVMDFGIARLAVREMGVTLSGMVVGTPAYMAPEQLLGEAVDARADLYAAGVVLYECLTARRPLGTLPPAALVGRMLTDAPVAPHLLEPSVPPALSAVVLRALAIDRDHRPRSAAELHALIVEAGRGRPARQRAGRPPIAPARLGLGLLAAADPLRARQPVP